MSRDPDAMLEAEPTQAHFLPPLPWKHSFTACHKGGRLVNGTGFLLRKTSFRKSAIPDSECVFLYSHLSNQLNNATGLLDLLLRQSAHPPGADDQRDLGQTALAEDLGVAQGQEVEDGNGVLLLASDVGVTGLDGDERPQLRGVSDAFGKLAKHSSWTSAAIPVFHLSPARGPASSFRGFRKKKYLVEVDDGLPEVVLLLVEVSHTDLSEVTGVVLFARVSCRVFACVS
jgi:hypothetical protein